MKKTLFVASLLACALPVLADTIPGMTLSGDGIANNDSWNLYATFDSLAPTDTFTTLATVNLNNNDWKAIYAVGYTYSSDNTLTLGMVSYANPNSWTTLSLGTVTLSAGDPVSFALSHSGSDNKLTLRGATGNTTEDFRVLGSVNSANADKYTNKHLSSVSLGTAATSTNVYGKSFVLTPATGNSVNIVSARLDHEAYSDAAFEEFVLEEQAFASDEVVRYTTTAGNQANVYEYNTPDGEVTFNPAKFQKNTDTESKFYGKQMLTLDNTIAMEARTTFIIVDENKVVEIKGAKHFTGADGKTHENGSVFGGGELVKSGDGTLAIRLNDTNRDIDSTSGVRNDYDGSVTVEEGTLYLFHDDENPSDFKARIGGGENSVITVKEGATLELGAQTEISIPLGAHTSTDPYAHNVVIDGGAVNVHADDAYHIPEMHPATSTIKNAVITRDGIDQVDPEVRAELIVAGITVFDAREGETVEFKHADILTDEFYFNGHTIISNTNLFADEVLIASSLGTEGLFSLEVVDNSIVVYGAGADAHSSGTWGHVDNVYVDQTSKLQTAHNKLEHEWGGALHIQGTCKLDIADKKLKDSTGGSSSDTGLDTKPDIKDDLMPDFQLPEDNAKGLAVRTDGTVQAVLDGQPLTLADISYVTDQLSGDMLIKYDEQTHAHGTLDLHLKDPVSALPDGKTLTNTVFTLTLTNFNSSLLVVNEETGELDKNVAKLTIDAFQDTKWHLVYGRYDKETNNSIFTFSTMENLHIVTPEPATATLSLLALAALAARRKRK